ncbi:MAG TPA: hypothetical protein VK651_05080 [Blastocatellia bacterium]|nr:hypothetical protein [Blastocatellia bacterium]
MHLGYFIKSGYNGKILAAFLLAMVACGLAPTTGGRADAVPDEWDEVFDTARAVLARMPDAARIEPIKDPPLREAVLRAYRALKACAKVNKNQSRTIKQGTLARSSSALSRPFRPRPSEATIRPARRSARLTAPSARQTVRRLERSYAPAS